MTARPGLLAPFLLLLALAVPAQGHGFLIVELTVEATPDGGVHIVLLTDRRELAAALQRAGTLAAELPAIDDDAAWAVLAPRLGELAAARLRLRDDAGRPLASAVTASADAAPALRLELQVPAAAGVHADLVLHPGHLPPPVYRIIRGAEIEVRHEGDAVVLSRAPPPEPWLTVLRTYLVQGVRHVVPEGADHVLFVLGLWLVAASLRQLLALATGFTLAHSCTLALAASGAISSDAWSRPIEIAIALSLVVVAVEAALARPEQGGGRLRLRWLLVLVFGLIHGFGFAGALVDLGLPRGQLVPALVGFNLGVEGGQLIVIATAALALGWSRRFPWHRRAVTMPVGALIGGCGLVWAVQRTFG